MQTTEAYRPDRRLAGPPANLRLTSWPLRDDKASAGIMISAAVLVSIGTGLVAQSAVAAVLGFVSFAVVLWRLWVPVQFELGPKGVVETILSRRHRIPWSAVRRCQIRRQGVLFLPTDDRTPLALLRGLYLRWGNRKEELLAIVNYYLGTRVHGDR